MPSAYTAAIYDGEKPTFRDFALKALRGMGVAMHMRDESISVPFRDREESTFYAETLQKYQNELAAIQSLTDEQAQAQADEEYIDSIIHINESNQKGARRKKDYEDMIAQVQAWTPPTEEHQGYKDFMLEQLHGSLKFDVHLTDLDSIKAPTGSEFVKERTEFLLKMIDTYTSEVATEKKRVSESNAWVRVVLESLPDE